MQPEWLTISGTTAGLRYELPVHTFGPADGRKIYIQGGLHADEGPGLITAQALRQRFAALDAQGALRARIVLVTMANPIGLGQRLLGQSMGRFSFDDGVNFNRDFPDLCDAVGSRIEARLGGDRAANDALVRAAIREAAGALSATTPAEHLKRTLLSLACDADLVLDLHCDSEAVVHLYTLPSQVEALTPLAAHLGARAILVSGLSGGHPFDEAVSRLWLEMRRRFPDRPLGEGAIATTVELRGRADVSTETAAADADAIVAFLTGRGDLAGVAPPVPGLACRPTPLEGSEALSAPVPGILVFKMDVGAHVEAGATVCEIIDPARGGITPVKATTSGVLYARTDRRMAVTGQRLGKIAGESPFRSGKLLSP